MDAISASANGSGFDAALKALEDLETSVVQTREEAAPVASPSLSIAPGDPVAPSPFTIRIDDEPAAITPVPAVDAASVEAEPAAPSVAGGPEAVAISEAPAEPSVVVAAPSGRLARIAVGLGLLSSLLSAAGLIVAERTIMSARLVVADARERQQQLVHAGELIRQLQVVRDRQVELLRAQRAQVASTPVTSEELQRKMDALQTGLLARDPLNDVIRAIREGQSDTNQRFSEFGMKMDRVEAALGNR